MTYMMLRSVLDQQYSCHCLVHRERITNGISSPRVTFTRHGILIRIAGSRTVSTWDWMTCYSRFVAFVWFQSVCLKTGHKYVADFTAISDVCVKTVAYSKVTAWGTRFKQFNDLCSLLTVSHYYGCRLGPGFIQPAEPATATPLSEK